MASTYLSRTFSASPTSDKIMTFSVWFKRSGLGEQHIFGNRAADNYRTHLYFDSADRFTLYAKKTDGSGNDSIDITTTRRFRDTNGWYHLVVAIDTTQATTADRVKIYFNGVLETSFAQEVNPAQNDVMQLNKDLAHEIGSYDGTNYYYTGYMSHIHFIDGTQYAASAFGETDSNGVWNIKTSPSVTYGNHGFFILKDGNSVTDQSGNSNNWAVTAGTLTDDKDNPSNVFATLNPLALGSGASLDNCGNSCNMDATAQFGSSSTLGMSSGKYYMEMKFSAQSGGADRIMLGISGNPGKLRNSTPWSGGSGSGYVGGTDGYGYYSDGGARYHGDSATAYGSSYTVNDIIGIALDLDNNRLFFSKNGTWQDSGDPTSSTGAISIAAPSTTNDGCYFFAVTDTSGVYGGTVQCNFGNGYFGTSAVSSAGTNASGHGVFEYDVPSGYTALCTKGLNE